MKLTMRLVLLLSSLSLLACGGSDADEIGIGAECAVDDNCEDTDEFNFVCLTEFTGGYCGLEGCTSDADCPETSACVTADSGGNYCARLCEDKVDCNANRSEDVEANCVGSVTFVDAMRDGKACEPSSSGM